MDIEHRKIYKRANLQKSGVICNQNHIFLISNMFYIIDLSMDDQNKSYACACKLAHDITHDIQSRNASNKI